MGFDKCLAAVKSSLWAKEYVVDSVWAFRAGQGNTVHDSGALVATSERIIYQGSALFGTGSSMEWRLGSLNGIATEKGVLREHVEINGGGAVAKFLVEFGEGKRFAASANRAISNMATTQPTAQPIAHQQPASHQSNLAEELSKLADLFSKGLLTEEEFASAKRKLIS